MQILITAGSAVVSFGFGYGIEYVRGKSQFLRIISGLSMAACALAGALFSTIS